MSQVAQVKFKDYETSISAAIDRIGAGAALPQTGLILIKPNLTNASPPPVTTDVRAVEAVYRYCRAHANAEIAIGEGVGSGRTPDVYAALGYTDLADKYGIRLIDFNESDTVRSWNREARHWRELYLPRIALEAFIISVPVLKDHSFTKTTIALKNMFGLAPARHYAGAWNKSKLHQPSTDEAVVDICLHKAPDLSVVDAAVALQGSHLWGQTRDIGFILAGFDPVAVDAVGSRLLGHDPEQLDYLRMAEGRLGTMKDIEILPV